MTDLVNFKYNADWRMNNAMQLLDTLTDGKPRPGLMGPAVFSSQKGQHPNAPNQRLLS